MKEENHNIKKSKKPWPTKDAMEQIYEMKLWGGSAYDFYSGSGSHDPKIVDTYLENVTSFLQSFDAPITICDLGCGDFNVGKELVRHSDKYFAIDIVSNLITRNKEKFKADNLEFHCLNIATDNLPAADCILLRQVLQHLSNAEVKAVLDKLSSYKYVILTEHIPVGEFTANKDIISGQGIRIKKQSGLNILTAPFNFKIKSETKLSSIILENKKGIIMTTLYQIF